MSRGDGKIWGGAPKIYWAAFKKYKIYVWVPQLKPVELTPLLGDLIEGGVLGAWSYKCMECPQKGRGDVFRQITSN